jgi:hemerythrin-like metal-binding protein
LKSQGRLQDGISKALDKLADYTVFHFSEERKLFAMYEYPRIAKHLADHDYFVNKVNRFQRELNRGNIRLSPKAMGFLKDWAIEHIPCLDKKFGEFVKKRTAKKMNLSQ